MREYETMYVLKAQTSDKEVSEFGEKLTRLVQAHKGEIIFNRILGRKALSYPMSKEKEGIYIHLDYAAEASIVEEFEKTLRLDERVLRFLTTQLQRQVDVPKRREELKALEEAAALGPVEPGTWNRDKQQRA